MVRSSPCLRMSHPDGKAKLVVVYIRPLRGAFIAACALHGSQRQGLTRLVVRVSVSGLAAELQVEGGACLLTTCSAYAFQLGMLHDWSRDASQHFRHLREGSSTKKNFVVSN